MYKKLFLLLFLFLAFPASVFAQQTMSVSESYECSYIVNSSYTSAGAVPSYQTPWADLHVGEGAITSSGGQKTLTLTKTNQPTGTTYYTPVSVAWYAWTGSEWSAISSTAVAKAWNLSSLHVDYWGVANLPAGGCPVVDPCIDAWPAKVAECGGAEIYVLNWDAEECTGDCDTCTLKFDQLTVECGQAGIAEWNPISCFGRCNCSENAVSNAIAACTDYGGMVSFDEVNCVGECVNCVEFEIDCPYGISGYNYETCEATCEDCGTRAPNCPIECEFNCSESVGFKPMSSCVCEDAPELPDPPDDEVPDPIDDPTDPADPPDDSPAPDGTNDNAILDKIERNTLATQQEVDRVGDILQTELNKANANLDDIENDVERGNDIAEDIRESVHDIENAIDEGTEATEEGNGLLQEIADNTEGSSGFLDTIASWFDGELTQADVDTMVADAESSLDSAWDTSESEMNTSIIAVINDETDVVLEDDISVFKSLAVAILPAERTCIDLDLSFQDKELIISCDHNAPVKAIFSYLVYIATILGIFALVHKEMRPE